MLNLVKRLVTEEEGQGMAEYGLILALIAVALIVALGALKGGVKGIFENVGTELGKDHSQ